MNLNHNSFQPGLAGLTVLQLTFGAGGEAWAVTSAGVLKRQDHGWVPLLPALPLVQAGLVHPLGKEILAAGLEGGMVLSSGGGSAWSMVWMGQVAQPVTCLLPSPNFQHDGGLVAGTAGDGILRSTNGGRSWNVCNFGLRSFTVLCLAGAQTWGWREPVFAGTEAGIFYSPNGGRAWKASGLPDKTVLSLAVHPNFPNPPILLAGLESEGLWRSTDGGKEWEPVDTGLDGEVSVNAVQYASLEVINLGTSEYGFVHSDDGGQTWKAIELGPESVLCLAQAPGTSDNPKLLGGTHEQGVWESADMGRTWQPEGSSS